MKTKQRQKGFTLIEIIIVIVIIGILAAIAIPGIMATFPRYRLRAEVNELIINFKKAKLEAVKRNKDVVIIFTEATGSQNGSYKIFVENSTPPNHVQDNIDSLLIYKELNKSVLLKDVTFQANSTWYDSRGMTTKIGSCQIKLPGSSKAFKLVLSTTGIVRVEVSQDGGSTWSAQ